MAALDKVTMEIATLFANGSKATAKRGTKLIKPKLSELISGKSRGEKKKVLKAVSEITAGKNTEQNKKLLFDMCVKNNPKAHFSADNPYLSDIVDINSDAYQLYSSFTHGITTRAAAHQAIERLHRNIPNIVNQATENLVPKVKFTPKEIDKILTDAMKQAGKDMLTLEGRLVSYPVNKLLSYTVPKATRGSFKQLAKLPRENFGKEYYDYLVKSKGLEGVAPAYAVGKESAPVLCKVSGGFSPLGNSIKFTKEFPTLSRAAQAEMLTHELHHFQQADSVIRTFGIDRYIQALKNGAIYRLSKSAEYAGKTKEEIAKIAEEEFKNSKFEEQIRKAFEKSTAGKKISPTSEEGLQAQKYMEALEQYPTIGNGIVFTGGKDYYSNLLEKEAYPLGRAAKRKFKIFERLNLKEA